ncbi:MAG: SRPBCC family protein [Acidobacteriota bacterium]
MIKVQLTKSIEIHAPRARVWNVLLQDEFTRIWYAEFGEGSQAETDWKAGSTIHFKDKSGNGLVSKVLDNREFEVISIEHQAVIINGREDFESDDAKKWKGCRETYTLSEERGVTTLHIEQEMPEEYLESFPALWDNALAKIKELAENQAGA